MEAVPLSTLEQLAQVTLRQLRANPHFTHDLVYRDYHGFAKATLPDGLMRLTTSLYGVDPSCVQAEIVLAVKDLSDEIHMHEESTTYCRILGQGESFPKPKSAKIFRTDSWTPLSEGQTYIIPPKTPHGFSVSPGGVLYFFSLQTPPIQGDGKDDYVAVRVVSPK